MQSILKHQIIIYFKYFILQLFSCLIEYKLNVKLRPRPETLKGKGKKFGHHNEITIMWPLWPL